MTRPPVLRAFLGTNEIHVDLFAGGGGASLGAAVATGRSPDVAINHSPEAIAMHAANHPETRHYIENVYAVDPRHAAQGRPVALLWLSPDCTHHSKAKGGKPRQQKIRGLAWSAIPWAQYTRPRVIILENVEEWADWGPVDRATGKPIKARRGQTFRAWKRKLERMGYVVEWRLLRACDYGAPTMRRRLFLVARCDGRPIRWPEPTHGPIRCDVRGAQRQLELGQAILPWRTAADVIDWSIPCPSIFDRPRALAGKTLARIVRGTGKHVINAAKPFLIPVNHGGVGRDDRRIHDMDAPMPTITGGQRGGHAVVAPIVVKAKTHGGGGNDAMTATEPLRTITASPRGEFAVVAPYLVHRSNGERLGQEPRTYDVQRPLGTIVAQGQKHAVCTAFLAKHFGDRPTGGWNGSVAADRPIDTITARDHHSVVAASLVKFRGTSQSHVDSCTSPVETPVPTISAGGTHIAAVAASLVRYNGDRLGAERVAGLETPLGTQDTSNRFGLQATFLARYNRTGDNRSVTDPLGTQDTTDRYAVVSAQLTGWTPEIEERAHRVYDLMVEHGYDGDGLDHDNRVVIVRIDGGEWVIVDIGMRMLSPRELFRAQGFPDDYVIDPIGPNGKPLTKTAQIRACGNSVPPQPVTALINAVFAA
jgi:DNA (cytosine-5)-methyltransferase 1